MSGGWCAECGKELGQGSYTTVIYDKCRNKTCPDCGKVRKLGVVKETDLGQKLAFKCLGCGEMKRIFVSRIGKKDENICWDCFSEREGKDGCICFNTKGFRLCPICDEVHAQPRICEECLKKQTTSYQRKRTFFKVVLPTALVSLVIGFFLGWLFLVKLRRKTKKKHNILS